MNSQMVESIHCLVLRARLSPQNGWCHIIHLISINLGTICLSFLYMLYSYLSAFPLTSNYFPYICLGTWKYYCGINAWPCSFLWRHHASSYIKGIIKHNFSGGIVADLCPQILDHSWSALENLIDSFVFFLIMKVLAILMQKHTLI